MIFAVTIPKSGTGLIRQILGATGPNCGHYATRAGLCADGPVREKDDVTSWIRKRAAQTGFATGHFHYSPQVREAMGNSRVIFLYRDPRDIVVSHVHFVLDHSDHPFHNSYKSINSFCRCMQVSMLGNSNGWSDIGERLLPYLPWYFDETVLNISYERLRKNTAAEVGRIASFLDCDAIADQMIAGIMPQYSHTYRAGRVGDYRMDMSRNNLDLFNLVAGWTLGALGYE